MARRRPLPEEMIGDEEDLVDRAGICRDERCRKISIHPAHPQDFGGETGRIPRRCPACCGVLERSPLGKLVVVSCHACGWTRTKGRRASAAPRAPGDRHKIWVSCPACAGEGRRPGSLRDVCMFCRGVGTVHRTQARRWAP